MKAIMEATAETVQVWIFGHSVEVHVPKFSPRKIWMQGLSRFFGFPAAPTEGNQHLHRGVIQGSQAKESLGEVLSSLGMELTDKM